MVKVVVRVEDVVEAIRPAFDGARCFGQRRSHRRRHGRVDDGDHPAAVGPTRVRSDDPHVVVREDRDAQDG